MRRSLAALATAFLFIATSAQAETIVFLIGEREYETKETLPTFAADQLEPLRHTCVFVHALAEQPNRFPGASIIDQADLLVISVRRRALPADDMARVRQHIAAGKPVIAIRTACHAFEPKGDYPEGYGTWAEFDTDVLGADYRNHLNNKEGTTIDPVKMAADHPVLQGVPPQPFHSGGTLYRMFDLAPGAELLANGSTTIDDQRQTFPVAWTRTLDGGSRVFTTTLGHTSDFAQPAFQRMLRNAVSWCLDNGTGPVAMTDRWSQSSR